METKLKEFVSLVRRMREAQKKIKGYSPTRIEKDRCQWENDLDNKAYLESEVDEYLKKMESIDQRKALEAENTEFDYGHNVQYYIEELWKT